MEIRHTVRRFPGAAAVLILALAAALAAMLALYGTGWHMGQTASPAVHQSATHVQQPSTGGAAPATTGPPCSWQQGGACSTTP